MLRVLCLVFTLFLCSCSHNEDENGPIMPGDDEDKAFNEPADMSNAAYNKRKLFRTQGVRNGRMSWRIPEKGGAFGKSPTLVFSSGKRYKIPNSYNNYRPGDGFVFKPGYKKNCTSKECDTSTSHGGIYLQAANGDRSNLVYIYY